MELATTRDVRLSQSNPVANQPAEHAKRPPAYKKVAVAARVATVATRRIPWYAGLDEAATNPERNRSARIQVKSRWRTGAEGFIIKNFDCDFVVVVLLNRGSKDGTAKVLAPEFYVLPVGLVKELHNPGSTWGKLSLSKIPGFKEQRDQWPIISKFLNDVES